MRVHILSHVSVILVQRKHDDMCPASVLLTSKPVDVIFRPLHTAKRSYRNINLTVLHEIRYLSCVCVCREIPYNL